MAGPLGIDYAGAWYHVMNRGAGRRKIFCLRHQREDLLAFLAVSCRHLAYRHARIVWWATIIAGYCVPRAATRTVPCATFLTRFAARFSAGSFRVCFSLFLPLLVVFAPRKIVVSLFGQHRKRKVDG